MFVPLSPRQQRQMELELRRRARLYSAVFFSVFVASALIISFCFYKTAKANYIHGNTYVYRGEVYKLLPEPEEIEIVEVDVDTISPFHLEDSTFDRVDLRYGFSEVKNQGRQGSCLAFALSSLMEYHHLIEKSLSLDFSEAFLYYETRYRMGNIYADSGSSWTDALDVAVDEGICLEQEMPYSQYDYTTPPSDAAKTEALQYRAAEILNIDRDIDLMCSFLSKGYPIMISVALFSSFWDESNGRIPMPTRQEYRNAQYGGRNHGWHAMVIVGYDAQEELFIVRNSWAVNFGDKGYCYMPYAYIADNELCRSACVIRALKI